MTLCKIRRFLLSVLFLLSAFSLAAQQRRITREDLIADPALRAGEYALYDFDVPAPAKPPKGFQPFYISHFGRHGARYAIGSEVYESLLNLLDEAARDGKLTPEGEALREHYAVFYPEVAHRGGDLTRIGQEQHRRIAARMYRDYPAVFKGRTYAVVRSTPVPRVMMSMLAFLEELKELDPDLSYDADAGYVHVAALDPMDKTNPAYVPSHPATDAERASRAALFAKTVDLDALTGRFFNDADYLEQHFGRWRFVDSLKKVILDVPCVDASFSSLFAEVFSAEELADLYIYRNYSLYLSYGRSPLTERKYLNVTAETLADLLDCAERDIASGTVALNLRFAHDSGLIPLVSLMQIEGFGIETDDPEEVTACWHGFEIPMAANLQLIFFRNRSGEILVQPLLNGREVRLPFPPVTRSFYAWETLRDYYRDVIASSRAYMRSYNKL